MATVYGHVPNQVARMAGNDAEMDRVAHTLLGLARGFATPHVDTTNYITKLKVRNIPGKKGVRDREVLAGDIAAMSIEYGHAVRVKSAGFNEANFKWVPGQYILTRAIASIPGYKYNSFGKIG